MIIQKRTPARNNYRNAMAQRVRGSAKALANANPRGIAKGGLGQPIDSKRMALRARAALGA